MKFSNAKIEEDELICEYSNKFLSAEGINAAAEFHIALAVERNCPTSLGLKMKEKDIVAPEWKRYSPGYVKVDKTHQGKVGVPINAYNSEDENGNLQTYPGCVYSFKLQETSNPNLHMEEDGVCEVNDEETGFKCADSITELYGGNNQEIQVMKN